MGILTPIVSRDPDVGTLPAFSLAAPHARLILSSRAQSELPRSAVRNGPERAPFEGVIKSMSSGATSTNAPRLLIAMVGLACDSTRLSVLLGAVVRRADSGARVLAQFQAGERCDLLLANPEAFADCGKEGMLQLQALTMETIVLLVDDHHLEWQLKQLESLNARNWAPPEPVRSHGSLDINMQATLVFWKGQDVDLTATEFKVIELFAHRAGENISYRDIYDVVHRPGFYAGDGEDGYHTNVRSMIKRIRRKFEFVDAQFNAIENHRGFGYRWNESDCPSTPPAAVHGISLYPA